MAAVVFAVTIVLTQMAPGIWRSLWTDDVGSTPGRTSSQGLQEIDPFDGRVRSLPPGCLKRAARPTGAGLIAAYAEGRVTITTPRSGRPISFRAPPPVRWSPSGQLLATGDGRLWTPRGAAAGTIGTEGSIWSWSPVADCVLSVEGGRLRAHLPGGQPVLVASGVHSFSSSPDGRWLALTVQGEAGTSLVLARADGGSLHEVARSGGPTLLGWTPDGTTFLFTRREAGSALSLRGVLRSGKAADLEVPVMLDPGTTREAIAGCGRFTVVAARDALIRIASEGSSSPIVRGVDVATPTCGGDERFVAATLDRKGPPHLAVFRRSGGFVRRLTRGGAFADLHPMWGRGSSGIVFARVSTVGEGAELWFVGASQAPAPTEIAVDRAEGLSYRDSFDWSVAGGG